MLCNENCRMGDPANHLILSIVVSGVSLNQKGTLPGRRFTHTRAAGARKPKFLISSGEPTEIIADVIAAQDFPHRKLLTTNITLIIDSIRRRAAAIGLDLTPAFSRVRATRAPPS
jgi:hypothetical protein